MKRQEGFILLTSLFFLALLALFVSYSLQSLFLYQKSLNQLIERKQNFYDLEFQARLLTLTHWEEGHGCVIKEQDPNAMLNLVTQQGCSLRYKDKNYRYLVEKLGVFPCLQVLSNDLNYSTQHWRITLLGESQILQLRIARPRELLPCEKDKVKRIPQGIISWRYLN